MTEMNVAADPPSPQSRAAAPREARSKAVTLVGIGDDGCASLTSHALQAVQNAQWLVGGERQLAFFPQFAGQRLVLRHGLKAVLQRVAELADESTVCILASGDPLFYGVGAQVTQALGAAHVAIVPHPSSVAWAFARIGVKWDDAVVLSLHGRRRSLVTRLRGLHKVAVLTDGDNHPAALAAHMLEFAATDWQATVCENICGPDERVRHFSLPQLRDCTDIAPLNVLLLQRPAVATPILPYLPETALARRMPKKGLITKREVRLLALAGLQLTHASIVWDIGAGSGAVSIEAAMLAAAGRVYAIEMDPEGVAICQDNVRAHGTDNVEIVAGRAPEALADLETPSAVFIGGSRGSMTPIVQTCLQRLVCGGRCVITAITLENAHEAYQALRQLNLTPEVTLLQVARGTPLAHYTRYEALNPIQIFAVTKP